MKPSNDYEALVLALTLAVTASDEKKVGECVQMANEFAGRLSEIEVERAKKQAYQNLNEEKGELSL